MMSSVTHIAGPTITACGRIIQRCSWCGEKLCDSKGVMMQVPADGSPPIYATWPTGRLIRISGRNPKRTLLLADSDVLPDDSCLELVE